MPTAPMTSGAGPDSGPRNPVPTPVLPRQDAKSNAASCNVAPQRMNENVPAMNTSR